RALGLGAADGASPLLVDLVDPVVARSGEGDSRAADHGRAVHAPDQRPDPAPSGVAATGPRRAHDGDPVAESRPAPPPSIDPVGPRGGAGAGTSAAPAATLQDPPPRPEMADAPRGSPPEPPAPVGPRRNAGAPPGGRPGPVTGPGTLAVESAPAPTAPTP